MSWFSESREWRSGSWSLQLRDDEFADIAFGDRVVLRSVRAVVRDHDWATAPLIVDRVRDSGSTLTLHVRSSGLGSSFRGIVRVEARSARLEVIADLESESPFDTNRTGLVVLHPPRVAGEALRVVHPDGSIEETRFPRAISPHQPVFDIAELTWLHEGSEVGVRFDGDVFEMEDQRNWSDASFKTYSRPLSLPFPYRVDAGERVVQSVSVAVREVAVATSETASDVIELRATGTFPVIALGASTAPDPAPTGLPPVTSELLVELDLDTPTWPAALARAAASGLSLDVRAVLPRSDAASAVAALAQQLNELDSPIARVAAFEPVDHITDAEVAPLLRDALLAAGVTAPIVGGTRAHFTELNREQHRIAGGLAGITFSITPLFHAVSTEQLIESVAIQRVIAQQSVQISHSVPVHIGPVTVRPRFNDVAASPEPAPSRSDLAEGYGAEFTGSTDDRQSASELAAWTIASAAALAIPGVASIAYFEEWGARGIRSSSGQDYPAADALRALSALAGGTLLQGNSPDGLIWAVGSSTETSTTILVANLSDTPRAITVEIPGRMLAVEVPARGFVQHC